MSLLEVGQIVRPHGLRGEVVVALVTNRLERLEPGTELGLQLAPVTADGAAAEAGRRPERLVVTSSRPHGGRFLVRFDGVGDLDAAEGLRGATLLAEPLEDPDALFVHELIGAMVVDGAGRVHGTVTAVEANPASDLLVLDGGQLVPLVFVRAHEDGRVLVDPPEGLLE